MPTYCLKKLSGIFEFNLKLFNSGTCIDVIMKIAYSKKMMKNKKNTEKHENKLKITKLERKIGR